MISPDQKIAYAKLQEAKEILAARQKRFTALNRLWEQGAIPQGDVEDAELAVKLAQQEVAVAVAEWEKVTP